MRIVTLLFAAAAAGCACALAQTAPGQSPAAQPSAQAPPQAPAAVQPAPAQAPPQPKIPAAAPSEAKRQDRAPPDEGARYRFRPIGSAVMRLDRQTGSVSVCRPHNVIWSCETASENSSALERQVAQLRDEIAALKKEVASLRAPPPPRPPADVAPRAEHDSGVRIELPTKEDIARARGFIADTWRRLVELIENLQKDMMRKS
jgi:hypothetical protein